MTTIHTDLSQFTQTTYRQAVGITKFTLYCGTQAVRYLTIFVKSLFFLIFNSSHALQYACREGLLFLAKLSILRGARIDSRNARGFSPLHEAAKAGSAIVAAYLIEKGAKIEERDHIKRTPLHLAAKHSHLDVASVLIKAGADVNARSSLNRMPIHEATKGGIEMIPLLAAAGANVNAMELTLTSAPLMEVLRTGDETLFATLVKAGANVNLTDHEGRTFLHYAAMWNLPRVVSLLIEAGAVRNIPDHPTNPADQVMGLSEETPLHYAVIFSCYEAFVALIDSGVQVDTVDAQGCTPLHYAAVQAEPDHNLFLATLLKANPNLNRVNRAGKTPLHEALYAGRTESAIALIQAGADTSLVGPEGFTPLHLAAEKGYERVVSALIEVGADKEAQCEGVFDKKRTLLHLAARKGKDGVTALLLKAGADIHALDFWKNTPLHAAVSSSSLRGMRLLVRFGADIERKNIHKQSPRSIVEEEKDSDQRKIKLQILYSNSLEKAAAFEASLLDMEKLGELFKTAPISSCLSIVDVLNQHNINARNSNGDTLLHISCEQALDDVAISLLAKGANRNLRNHKGESANSVALRKVFEFNQAIRDLNEKLGILEASKSEDDEIEAKAIRGKIQELQQLRSKLGRINTFLLDPSFPAFHPSYQRTKWLLSRAAG